MIYSGKRNAKLQMQRKKMLLIVRSKRWRRMGHASVLALEWGEAFDQSFPLHSKRGTAIICLRIGRGVMLTLRWTQGDSAFLFS